VPVDDAVGLQFAELAGQHARGDGGQQPLEFAEPADLVTQVLQDHQLPLAADDLQRQFGRAVDAGALQAGPHDLHTIRKVRSAKSCAYLSF
jgi:hypothetical protein